MALQNSRHDYVQRMHKVMRYIDQHLDQSLDLAQLAEVAHFSPYHFHRLFLAWTGETLGDYIRRRRLELGGVKLITQPQSSVLEIALSVGFGSAEAFARAFKLRFSYSPTAWRQQQRGAYPSSNLDQVDRNINQVNVDELSQDSHFPTMTQVPPMNVTLIHRQPVSVAYFRHIGPYGPSLGDFWRHTVYPWLQTNQLLAQPRYGIGYDDPSTTAPAQCRYDACVEVPPQRVLTGQPLRMTIPGGDYASFHFEADLEQLPQAWIQIFRDWLPSSGMQLDERPCFEYYPIGGGMNPETGIMRCDICIPVVPA